MKVAVIGASGQLGSDIVKIFSQDSDLILFPLTHVQIDITKTRASQRLLDDIQPEVIINTAAFHKVDEVEKNPKKAFAVNGIAALTLARYAEEKSIALMFLSTDYVFGSQQKRRTPYRESDLPGPVNVYGVSKLAGEAFIRTICSKFWIVRTSGLFGTRGASGKGGNFVETMLKLAATEKHIMAVDDQVISPTYTVDLARQLLLLMKSGTFGIFHASSHGECSWFEFAKAIFSLTGTPTRVQPVTSAEWKTAAARPRYCVLENEHLKHLGIDIMPHWKEGLSAYLREKRYR